MKNNKYSVPCLNNNVSTENKNKLTIIFLLNLPKVI